MKQLILATLLCVIVFGGRSVYDNNIRASTITKNEIKLDTMELTFSNLSYVLDYYNVKHKDIVIKQFILETGWGKSYSCKVRNNLFGLTNPRTKDYFSFKHWTQSVKGYKNSVQYKYKNGDYFKFLKELPYAEDPNYINKLKQIKYDI